MKSEQPLKGKTVLMVLAPTGFQEDEFGKPSELLDQLGAAITIASKRKGTLYGISGSKVIAHGLITEYQAADFDAVLFIGGPGAEVFFDDPAAHQLAREALDAPRVKVLGAICIAPVTLANAGVLNGKHATAFSSVQDQIAAQGAMVERKQSLVQNGKIITASGPQAAPDFAQKIVTMLLQF